MSDHTAISRRKLLAAIGITGTAAVLGGASIGAASKGGAVLQSVYGKEEEADCCCSMTTIAALRANTAPVADAMYYVSDPGQEGHFYYDSADTTSPDDTGLTLASTSGARFKRIHEAGYVNVKWFGAKGDGATDDTDAINRAIGNGQVTVHIPEGTYLIDCEATAFGQLNAGIQIKDDTTLFISANAILKAIPTASERYTILNIYGRQNVTVEGGGKIIGERSEHTGTTGQWGYGIAIGGSERVFIRNLYLADCWGDGAVVASYLGSANRSKKVVFTNVHCYNNRRQGVSVIAAEDVLFQSCIFENTNGQMPQSGIDLVPDPNNVVSQVTITGCLFLDNVREGLLLAGALGTIERVVVEANQFTGNLRSGISTIQAKDVVIQGNVFDSNGLCIQLDNARNHRIEGNSLQNSTGRGLNINTSASVSITNNNFFNIKSNSLRFNQSNYCLFAGNVIDECGDTPNSSDVLITGGSSYNSLQGNMIRNRLKQAGTAKSGTTSSIALADSASATTGEYNNMLVYITGGTGYGQKRKISSYDGTLKVANVSTSWTVIPDATSVYEVRYGSANGIAVFAATELYNLIQNNELIFGTAVYTSNGISDHGTATSMANNLSF